MEGAFRYPLTFCRVVRNALFNLLDPPVLILTYHRVTALQSDPHLLAVTPHHFRAHLQLLKEKFPVIRFDEDWSKIKKPAVAITFDDGYADNVLEALPILEDAGVPAAFFISTGAVGTGRWSNVGEDASEVNRPMTIDELRRLGQSRLVAIGAHSINHPRLSSLPEAEQRKEIEGSKKELELWLGREVTIFSYPFGQRRDYTQETASLCRKAGFTRAAANFPGQVHRWTDPYQMPRLVVRNWSVEVFEKHLRRFWIV